ncbi:MAG: DUF2784 family protein [candidate division NC10 bacterium]|nr:DUF2784 family protein [candidate division NC10 bacterium]
MRTALRLTDRFLHMLHLTIIVFCMVGWVFQSARVVHLVVVIGIACSWFILGRSRGYGYCLITDLQRRVRKRLGDPPGPDSFVKYQLDRLTGMDFNPQSVEAVIQTSFYLSALASIYVNFAP